MADALLDDLDDLSDVDSSDEAAVPSAREVDAAAERDDHDHDHDYGGDDDGDDADDGADGADLGASTAGAKRPRLLDDPALKLHLSKIRGASATITTSSATAKAVPEEEDDDDDESQHALVIASNRHLVSLGHEVHRTHLELRRLYHPKFPELEELLTDPYQYRAAVGTIRNEMDVASRITSTNNDGRRGGAMGGGGRAGTREEDGNDDDDDDDRARMMLTSNQVITISVAGSTTSGRALSDDELRMVDDACAYMDELRNARDALVKYVEERAGRWCPSVSALIGPSLAARLLGCVGGLGELCRVPACNLHLLGKRRGGGSSSYGGGGGDGLATRARDVHAGYLVECDLVASLPKYLCMRAVKAVAGKLALAIRSDHVNVECGRTRSSDVGRRLREELVAKFAKWEEPDKAQVVKALPKPDLTTKKRRGGKRIRRLKERFEETEMMKQANRRAFSTESGEYGDDAMGLTLGMLDSKEGGGGAIRNTVEKKKMRYANTKASRKKALQMGSGGTSGLASSMVFTPAQGLELVNPDANRERIRQANAKFFSENAGFQSALPKK